MIRVVNLKVWVALIVTGITAAIVVALLAGGAKPAQAGAFPGKNGRIAFDSTRGGTNNFEIYSMNPDGSLQTNLSHSVGNISASYSANGKKISFSSARDGNSEIYSMNANGTLQTRLSTNPASDQFPSYSPDGKKIAYRGFKALGSSDDEDYDSEIYTINVGGGGKSQVTDTIHYARSPSWGSRP